MSKGQVLKNSLVKSLSEDCSYAEQKKLNFHKTAKQFLRQVQKDLQTTGNIRSNMGGIAVSGEVTLHTDSLYLQFSQYFGTSICLYRTCNGTKDFRGGRNNFLTLQEFDDCSYEDFLRKVDI